MTAPGRSVLRGLGRLAFLRADGLLEFANTPQAFLNSLAPLTAFALVAAGLGIAQGDVAEAVLEFLITVVALLMPPVLSHFFAARWRRADVWPRYAAAFNWCHWLVLFAFAAIMLVGNAIMVGAGLRPAIALLLAELAWAGYGLSLHWLLARRGLGLARWQALVLLIVVELGTGAAVIVPLLARRMLA